MLSEPPIVSFVGRESSAVNPRLLSGADADHLAVLGQADRVALSVFQRDQRHEDVSLHLGGQRLKSAVYKSFSFILSFICFVWAVCNTWNTLLFDSHIFANPLIH